MSTEKQSIKPLSTVLSFLIIGVVLLVSVSDDTL